MSKREKLIQKIIKGEIISYGESENILNSLGYVAEAPNSGSSHITFRKDPLEKITLVLNRKELKPYQIKMLQKALRKAGF